MKTPNTGVETAQNQSKVGAIKGLSAKIVTALAALGIATSVEKVEGATIIPTVTTPTTWTTGSGTGNVAQESSTIPGRSQITTGRFLDNTYQSTFQTVLSAEDMGIYGGVLTISGSQKMVATTGNISTLVDMDAKFQYSIDGGPAIDISSINSIAQLNDATSSLTDGNTQAINVLNNFSLPVALAPGAHTITFTHIADSQFVGGQFLIGNSNFTQGIGLSLNQNIVPETSTSLLAISALTAGLLRRKRENKESV